MTWSRVTNAQARDSDHWSKGFKHHQNINVTSRWMFEGEGERSDLSKPNSYRD